MAATTDNSFIAPPPLSKAGDYSFASTVEYGSPRDFRWTSNYNIPLNLSLIQETAFLNNDTIQVQTQLLAANLTNTSYLWSGEPGRNFNLSLSNTFWLGMDNGSSQLFASEYFNVTSRPTSSSAATTFPSSSSSSSASFSSSTTSSSLSSTLPAQVTTKPASTTPSASPRPSGTPKSATNNIALGAGLGAGLGGAALIIVLSVFLFLGSKRQGRSRKRMTPEVYQLADNDPFSR